MGLSYHKTFKLGPLLITVGSGGLRLGLRTPFGTITTGKHGTHFSVGRKGFHYSKRLK